ncbi:hypothetical protein [Methanoregula sp.]|uniref:hypothetical protein n=1 Tax=Methanoregula sp. TaxID=2052170 RepID=UPI00356957F1
MSQHNNLSYVVAQETHSTRPYPAARITSVLKGCRDRWGEGGYRSRAPAIAHGFPGRDAEMPEVPHAAHDPSALYQSISWIVHNPKSRPQLKHPV